VETAGGKRSGRGVLGGGRREGGREGGEFNSVGGTNVSTIKVFSMSNVGG
jgi:hypothetical protein